MRIKTVSIMVALFFAVWLGMAGCHRSGSAPTVSGTASEGALITGATVRLKDAAGKSAVDTITDATTGFYSFDVTGLTAPFLVTVTGATGPLVSLARSSGTVNINPVTTIVVSLAAGTTDMSALFVNLTPLQITAISAMYAEKVALVTAALQAILPFGVKAERYFTEPVEEGIGMDEFFDYYEIVVHPADGITITTKDVDAVHLLNISAAAVAANTNPLPAIVMPDDEAATPLMNGFGSFTSVIRKQAPTVMLHPDENYYPSSIDWYLNRNTALFADGTTTKYSSGQLTRDVIAPIRDKYSYVTAPDTDLSIKQGMKNEGASNWPAYVAAAKVTIKNGADAGEYLIAQYNTFYAYNTLSWPYDNADHHFGDWERVSMLWKKDNSAPDGWKFLAVLTKAHTEDLIMEKTPSYYNNTDRVKVWAAQNSHGTHPNWLFCDGFMKADVCGDGIPWDMRSSPIEIVQFREYVLDSRSFVTFADYSTAGGKKNINDGNIAAWRKFAGKWGGSREAGPFNPFNNPWVTLYNVGDSPGTYMGVYPPAKPKNPPAVNTSELSFLSQYLLNK